MRISILISTVHPQVLTEVHASFFGADNADPSQPQLQEEEHRSSGSGGRRGFPAALMLASPFRSSKPPRDGAEGGNERQGAREQPPLPVRILVVSHGGLLLQMFQKVFNLHAVTRVLNASLTVVEARLPTSHPHHASAITNHRRRLALIFASPTSSRRAKQQPQTRGEGEGGEEEEDEAAVAQLAAATAFRPVKINDVAHLEALHIVTTKSTAL